MITSPRNARVAAARKLRRPRVRRETRRTLIEGPFLLEEARSAGIIVDEVFALAGDAETAASCHREGWQLHEVAPDVMAALASSVNPRGPVAVAAIPDSPQIECRDSVVLWGVADPGNAGTIIRTAGAFGFQVIATAGSVDLWSPKVVSAGVGGHFRANPVEGMAADLVVLQAAGLRPLVATSAGVTRVDDAVRGEEPVALVVGNEAHGVPEEVIGAPGVETFMIPMPGGTESLNAAVAASISMYLRIAGR